MAQENPINPLVPYLVGAAGVGTALAVYRSLTNPLEPEYEIVLPPRRRRRRYLDRFGLERVTLENRIPYVRPDLPRLVEVNRRIAARAAVQDAAQIAFANPRVFTAEEAERRQVIRQIQEQEFIAPRTQLAPFGQMPPFDEPGANPLGQQRNFGRYPLVEVAPNVFVENIPAIFNVGGTPTPVDFVANPPGQLPPPRARNPLPMISTGPAIAHGFTEGIRHREIAQQVEAGFISEEAARQIITDQIRQYAARLSAQGNPAPPLLPIDNPLSRPGRIGGEGVRFTPTQDLGFYGTPAIDWGNPLRTSLRVPRLTQIAPANLMPTPIRFPRSLPPIPYVAPLPATTPPERRTTQRRRGKVTGIAPITYDIRISDRSFLERYVSQYSDAGSFNLEGMEVVYRQGRTPGSAEVLGMSQEGFSSLRELAPKLAVALHQRGFTSVEFTPMGIPGTREAIARSRYFTGVMSRYVPIREVTSGELDARSMLRFDASYANIVEAYEVGNVELAAQLYELRRAPVPPTPAALRADILNRLQINPARLTQLSQARPTQLGMAPVAQLANPLSTRPSPAPIGVDPLTGREIYPAGDPRNISNRGIDPTAFINDVGNAYQRRLNARASGGLPPGPSMRTIAPAAIETVVRRIAGLPPLGAAREIPITPGRVPYVDPLSPLERAAQRSLPGNLLSPGQAARQVAAIQIELGVRNAAEAARRAAVATPRLLASGANSLLRIAGTAGAIVQSAEVLRGTVDRITGAQDYTTIPTSARNPLTALADATLAEANRTIYDVAVRFPQYLSRPPSRFMGEDQPSFEQDVRDLPGNLRAIFNWNGALSPAAQRDREENLAALRALVIPSPEAPVGDIRSRAAEALVELQNVQGLIRQAQRDLAQANVNLIASENSWVPVPLQGGGNLRLAREQAATRLNGLEAQLPRLQNQLSRYNAAIQAEYERAQQAQENQRIAIRNYQAAEQAAILDYLEAEAEAQIPTEFIRPYVELSPPPPDVPANPLTTPRPARTNRGRGRVGTFSTYIPRSQQGNPLRVNPLQGPSPATSRNPSRRTGCSTCG